MSAVYVVPLPLKLLAEPFPTVISPTTKPVTLSLNVIVTGIGEVFVVADAVDVMLTVGTVLSYVLLSCVAAVLLLPAASVATPAAMSTVTAPWALGVMSTV
jgi:hypothetical protein